MSQNQAPRGTFLQEVGFHIRLLFLLFFDRRVSFGTRLVFLAGIAFALNPYDHPSPIDDMVVFLLLSALFILLSPPQVVSEHLNKMRRTIPGKWRDAQNDPDVIDVKFIDPKDKKDKP